MPEENGGNKRTGLLDKVQEDAKAFKEFLQKKGKEELEGLKEPEKTQLFRSIFRVKHDETPRNRALSVLTNVFFHLHPAKINRDAVRYSYSIAIAHGIAIDLGRVEMEEDVGQNAQGAVAGRLVVLDAENRAEELRLLRLFQALQLLLALLLEEFLERLGVFLDFVQQPAAFVAPVSFRHPNPPQLLSEPSPWSKPCGGNPLRTGAWLHG